MNTVGIVRKVDELGRLVIPKETRDMLFIHEGDALEIFQDEEAIYLKKYTPGCAFCAGMKDLTMFKGQYVCDECREKLLELIQSHLEM